METKALFLKKAAALAPSLQEREVRPVRTVSPARAADGTVTLTETGDYRSLCLRSGDTACLDFGDHFVGHLTLCLGSEGSHPDAPAWLQIQFAERPQELFEDVGSYHGWISKGWIQQEQLHVDVLPATVALPRRYAFRYVKLTVLDVSSKYALRLTDCLCRETTCADASALPAFPLDDPELARIDAVGCRTLRSCMQTVFEDGPKRDRRLWLGDLRLQALASYASYRNDDLVKRCLYLFAGTANAEGRVAACLFTEPEVEADDTYMFDYSLFFIPTLRDYWRATGDRETLEELWPTALRQVELARANFDETGLVRDSDVLGWCFVDWNLDLNKQAGAQAIYLYCLRALTELAEALGEQSLCETLREEYQAKKQRALSALWDNARQVFVSGRDRQISWASQVWMILAGVLDPGSGAALLRRVAVMPEAEKMVTPYLYHHYVDALLSVGEKERALQTIRDYWGGMAAQGADTFWELYDPSDPNASPYGGTVVNSFCHAWSCTPTYFLRNFFLSRINDAKAAQPQKVISC